MTYMKPQWKIVLNYLEEHGEIDEHTAYFKLKVQRLPLRIIDLRKKGYVIDSVFYEKLEEKHLHKYVYRGMSITPSD